MKDNLKDVGIWGQRHYQYQKETKPSIIGVMRMNGNLIPYLQSVDEQADEMTFQLVNNLPSRKASPKISNAGTKWPGVRVSGGDLCRRQKHRPRRQPRPVPLSRLTRAGFGYTKPMLVTSTDNIAGYSHSFYGRFHSSPCGKPPALSAVSLSDHSRRLLSAFWRYF